MVGQGGIERGNVVRDEETRSAGTRVEQKAEDVGKAHASPWGGGQGPWPNRSPVEPA